MKKSASELSDLHSTNLSLIDRALLGQKMSIAELSPLLPGIFHIHRLDNLAVTHMCPAGCAYLNQSETNLIAMGQDYLTQFFDPTIRTVEHAKAHAFFQRATESNVHCVIDRVRQDPQLSLRF